MIVRRLTLSALRAAAPQGNKGVVPTDAVYKKIQQKQIEMLVNTALLFFNEYFKFILVHHCYY